MPLEFTVPPVADQVTALLVVPVTVAVNCWFFPGGKETEFGVTLRLTAGAFWLLAGDKVQPIRETTHRESSVRTSFRVRVCSATFGCFSILSSCVGILKRG